MSLKRTKTLLAAWTLVLLAGLPALGQGLQDGQIFAPADLSTLGGGPRANEGFFCSFEVMLGWIDRPETALIGDGTTRQVVVREQVPDLDPQDPTQNDPNWVADKVMEFSTHDTGLFPSKTVNGQRYEFGFVQEHHGWLFSGYNINQANQKLTASNAHVVFQDAPFGPGPSQHLQGYVDVDLTEAYVDDLAVRFDNLLAVNSLKTWSVELNYLYRMHPNHQGGIFELFLGARYMEFDEQFNVDAIGERGGDDTADPPVPPDSTLANSYWNTAADNHIIGPQIGGRWFRSDGRWTCSTEGRFFAGFNSQNIHQQGLLGSKINVNTDQTLRIINMEPTGFDHRKFFSEWSPGAELRINFDYQLTRSVSAGVGWTGFWIDSLARPSDMVSYVIEQDSVMGITTNNRQGVFSNWVTFYIGLNR